MKSHKWMSGSYAYIGLVLLAGLLACVSLGSRFFLDDFAHLTGIMGVNPLAKSWDLFCFASDNEAQMKELINRGPYPWFLDLNIKVHFFRPLSSILMALDYFVFGKNAAGYHLHSALWYLALAALVAILYKRYLPRTLGLLALLIFVVDESHAFPVVWWSNRNALIAAVFGLAGVLAHFRWREEGWKLGFPLSLLAFIAAFLAGESGLGVLAYLLAYELLAAPGSWRTRIACLTPVSILVLGYLAAYKALGYGVSGMPLYLDPMAVPWDFLTQAPIRFLCLVATQLVSFPCELPAMLSAAVWPSTIYGAILLLGVVLWLRAAWPGLDTHERRILRWLCAGTVLSTAPFLAAFTSGRLLIIPSIGGSVILAVLIRHGWTVLKNPGTPGRFPRLTRTIFWAFVAIHLIIAPLTWLGLGWGFRAISLSAERAVAQMQTDPAVVNTQYAFIVYAPDPVIGFYPPAMMTWFGQPQPKSWNALSMAPFAHRIVRTRPDCIELSYEGGEMFTTLPEGLLHDPLRPYRIGDRVETNKFTATILETGTMGPKKVEFQFQNPVDSPEYLFLTWREGGLRQFPMPAVGESILLPQPPLIPEWARLF